MSRSLGTLTLDLVARIGGFEQGMDKAARHSQRRMNDVQRSAQQVRRAITGAFAAIGVGLSARAFQNMIRDTARVIDEQAKLARRLNTTSAELAGLELAGELAGVSINEISTASRQLEINIGRAIQGTVAQSDAFDRLGLSAQEVARIPLAERIATINQALEDNVPASQRAAVAAEIFGARSQQAIRQLDPDAIREASGEIERYGLAISELDAANVEAMNDSLTRLQKASDGFKTQLTAQLAPAIGMVAEELTAFITNSGDVERAAQDMAETIITASAFAINAIDGVGRATRLLANSLIIAYEAANLLPAIDWKDMMMVGVNPAAAGSSIVKRMLGSKEDNQRDADISIGIIREALAAMSSDINDPLAGEALVARLRESLSERDAGGIRVGVEIDDEDLDDAAANIASQFDKISAGLQQQIALFGQTGEAAKLRYQIENDLIDGLSGTQGEYLLGLAEQLDQLKTAAEFSKEVERIIDSAIPASQRQMQSLREDMLLLQMAFDEGQITIEQFSTTMQHLEGRLSELQETGGGFWEQWLEGAQEALTTFDELAANVAENFSRQFGNAFESAIFDSESLGDAMRGLGESMLRSVVNALGQMAAQWVAYHAVQMALGKSSEAAAIAGAAVTGTSIASAYAPAAAMASLASFGANAAPAMAGITSTVAMAQGSALLGMAHDGIDSVPKTGTWLLEKGERVMTSETSAKLDRKLDGAGGGVTVNLIEDSSKAGGVNQRSGENGEQEVDVFVADIRGDGPRSRAMQQAFGLQRRGA